MQMPTSISQGQRARPKPLPPLRNIYQILIWILNQLDTSGNLTGAIATIVASEQIFLRFVYKHVCIEINLVSSPPMYLSLFQVKIINTFFF